MSIPEIIAALFGAKGATADRIRKAKGQAKRSNLEWTVVVAAMSPAQRALVESA